MKSIYLACILLFVSSLCLSQVRPYKVAVYDSTTTGYYFLASSKTSIPKGISYLMVLDHYGELVFFAPVPNGVGSYDFKLEPGAMVSFNVTGKHYLVDSTFNVKDSVTCKNGILTDNHDIQILPNGHYLLLGEETVTMDLSAYPYFRNGAYGSTQALVLCGVIQELDAAKNVVFEWHTKDYFSFDSVDKFWLSDSTQVDWTHCNAVELDDDGNILLSTRHFNEITKINRSDSSIMWRMGGKYNQFNFLNDPVQFYGPHDIRRLANGNITLYDNGYHFTSHGSRALEYTIDEINKTANLQWSYIYDATMYSKGTGNVQRHASSNTLVNFGLVSKNDVCFTVVKPSGAKVFELAFDDSSIFSYRAFYYPDLPFSFKRPLVTCFESSGTAYLDAGAGYNSYKWSNGATTQVIAVTAPGTYSVYVPYGVGFITSEKRIVSNITNICSVNSVPVNSDQNKFEVFPNPGGNELWITGQESWMNEKTNVDIYNTLGENVLHSELQINNSKSFLIDISSCSPGLYFVKINDRTIKFVKQ